MDHPLNTKGGGVCIYYKESLVVKITNISYLQECLLCEVMIDNIKGYIALIYRSPSKNNSESQHFLSGFERYLSLLKTLSLTLQFYQVIIRHVEDHGGLPIPTRWNLMHKLHYMACNS